MNGEITVLGISGSLRTNSYNTAILKAAQDLVPEGMVITIFRDLRMIPLFDQDGEQNLPEAVKLLKTAIRATDAVLLATPEYNYSFPGVLKNAIDWASRPYGNNAWDGKPVALMSASASLIGGARAQYQLRQTFVFLNMYPLNKPEVIISQAEEKINTRGQLTDKASQDKIAQMLAAFKNWIGRLQGQPKPEKETETEDYPYHRAYAKFTLR